MLRKFVIFGLFAVAVTACQTTENAGSTSAPPPATADEVAIFCERYEEVKDLSYGERFTALIDVAPLEIRASLERMVNNPGPTDDDFKVDAFLDKCNQ